MFYELYFENLSNINHCDVYLELVRRVLSARYPNRKDFYVYEVMDVLFEVGIETYVDNEEDLEKIFAF